MLKRKLWILVSLVALLGVITALALSVGRISPQALSSSDPDLLVPAVGKPNPNWQAQPVPGAPVALPWANIRVNPDAGSAAQNEPFVAVDPRNPLHLVVGANNWAGANGQFEVAAYASFDGGRSWAASAPYINRNASRLNAADPTLAFAPDGSLYFAFVAFGPADGAVAVSRSLDGGRSWTNQSWATGFTAAADKPALVAGGSNLYLLWQGANALLARTSPDGGASWGSIATVAFGGRNAAPVVDRTGALNVFYTVGTSLLLGRSLDQGATYNTTTVSSVTPLQPRPTAYRATVYPAAAATADGSLVVAWADGRNAGHGNDILASRSVDAGASWSTPLVVNQDSGAADQLMPAVTVGSDGAVTVAWLDTRNDPARVNYDVYLARTAPAGTSFSFGANQRVTSQASNPNNDPQLQGSLIGDYFAIGAGAGVVYPVWTDTRNNNEDIYLAPVPTSPRGSNN